MSNGVRLLRPDRRQLRWDVVDLDSQLPAEHRARIVWAFVEAADLSAFYKPVKAHDEQPGRPATIRRAAGAVAVCHARERRLGPRGGATVSVSCGRSLAVRRRAGEPRPAGDIDFWARIPRRPGQRVIGALIDVG